MNADGYAIATIAPLRAQLVEAEAAGDIERLRDVQALSRALQEGARTRGLGISAENEAAEIVLRSERAMGRVLIQMEAAGTRSSGGRPTRNTPTLQDLLGHVSRSVSWEWQQLARMSDEDFEAEIAAAHEQGRRLARVTLIRRRAGPSDRWLAEGSPQNAGLDLARRAAYTLSGYEVGEDGTGELHSDKAAIRLLAIDEMAALHDIILMLAETYTVERRRRAGSHN